ncbi:MAG: cell division protein FtsW [Candidatus Azotimanducaceae bacterium]|jgi:cell division protein FtsW
MTAVVDKAFPLDPYVASAAAILLFAGVVLVGSASTEIAARTYGNSLHLLIKHVVYLGISVAVAAGALMVPIRAWQRLDMVLLLVSFVLLVAVLIPGIGHKVNGSTRWISLGFFTIQGSEFVKFFSAVYIAGYLVRRQEAVMTTVSAFVQPLVVLGVMVGLLILQPDFGASVVIMAAMMGAIFLAGVPFSRFLPLILLVFVITIVIAQWQPYRLERLTTFSNPWDHQFDSGYQLTQALIAFGRGEWFGLGIGNSIQKLFFLPEAHTDFLFSIVAEEYGVLGAILFICLFFGMVIRGIWIGRRARQLGLEFHALLAYTISILLGVQATINIGVNIGLLPTKGLTLPLVSYGGNSLIVSCVLVAVLLRIEYESRNTVEPLEKSKNGANKSGARSSRALRPPVPQQLGGASNDV